MSVTETRVYSDGSSGVIGEILDVKYDLWIDTDGDPELSVTVPDRIVIGIWGPWDVGLSAFIQGFQKGTVVGIIVNDVEYDSVYMSVYDRVGKRADQYKSRVSPVATVAYYNGINTDGVRYVKSLYGYIDGRKKLIARSQKWWVSVSS